MSKVRYTTVLLLLLEMCISSCANDHRDRVDVIVPDGVLNKTEFINVLTDIQMIEAGS